MIQWVGQRQLSDPAEPYQEVLQMQKCGVQIFKVFIALSSHTKLVKGEQETQHFSARFVPC